MVQYTFIYKHEHFKCIGRYRYIYYILVLLLIKCTSTFGMWFRGMTSLHIITIFTKESPSAPSAPRFAHHSPEAPQSDASERATSRGALLLVENHMDITNIRTLWVHVSWGVIKISCICIFIYIYTYISHYRTLQYALISLSILGKRSNLPLLIEAQLLLHGVWDLTILQFLIKSLQTHCHLHKAW